MKRRLKLLNKDINFQEGIEEINLDSKISFLVGENNTGKTLLLNQINSGDVEMVDIDEKGLQRPIDYEVLYIKSTSDDVTEENSAAKNSISKENSQLIKMKNTIRDYEKKSEQFSFKETGIKLIDELNAKNNIEFIIEEKISLKREFENIDSSLCGSGIGRITYLTYLLDMIITEFISKVDRKSFIIDNILNVLNNSKIDFIIQLIDDLYKKRDVSKFADDFLKIISLIFSERDYEIYVNKLKSRVEHLDILKYNYGDIKKFNEPSKMEMMLISNALEDIDLISFRNYINDLGFATEHKEIKKPSTIYILIDEPEKYLHFSMFETLKVIVDKILSFHEYDIRFIFSTHSERIISMFRDNLESLNICRKKEGIITYKNLFNNKFDYFVKECNDDLIEISNDKKREFTSNYVKWILTTKENSKLLFTNEVTFMEGFSEYYLIRSLELIDDSKLIIADGVINYIIFHKLTLWNERNFERVRFIFDVDTKYKKLKKGEEVDPCKPLLNAINKNLINKLITLNNSYHNEYGNSREASKFTIHTMYFDDIINQLNKYIRYLILDRESSSISYSSAYKLLNGKYPPYIAIAGNTHNILNSYMNNSLKSYVNDVTESIKKMQLDFCKKNNFDPIYDNPAKESIISYEESEKIGFNKYWRKINYDYKRDVGLKYQLLKKSLPKLEQKVDVMKWFVLLGSEYIIKNNLIEKYKNFFKRKIIDREYFINFKNFKESNINYELYYYENRIKKFISKINYFINDGSSHNENASKINAHGREILVNDNARVNISKISILRLKRDGRPFDGREEESQYSFPNSWDDEDMFEAIYIIDSFNSFNDENFETIDEKIFEDVENNSFIYLLLDDKFIIGPYDKYEDLVKELKDISLYSESLLNEYFKEK